MRRGIRIPRRTAEQKLVVLLAAFRPVFADHLPARGRATRRLGCGLLPPPGAIGFGARAITVAQSTDAVVVGQDASVLPFDYSLHARRQYLLESFLILHLGVVLAFLDFLEYR